MAATINGVKLKKVELTIDDKGQLKQEGNFALELGNGIQVGQQNFGGGWGEQFQFAPSAETLEARNKFYDSLRGDISRAMGLT